MEHSNSNQVRFVLYGLFILSGFSGLIYESIWSHYLKLFLGHAAYAQSLVLVIFMGGMALGSWLAGKLSHRLSNPLLIYALVEGILGIAAFGFDVTFRGMQTWIFDSVIPAFSSTIGVDAIKWSFASLLILPQSVLLGATFPLMSASIVRKFPQLSGMSLAWLYFTNSLGASVGVLASGFILIDWVGLPGTILTAGLINFFLALTVWFISRHPRLWGASAVFRAPEISGNVPAAPFVMLLVAFLTGMASFLYEVGWIRMLSLVLGSATHSFELMLSAFILGLAFGSFYIRNRIGKAASTTQLLGWVQVLMGTVAFISIPVYNLSFDWMATIIQGLQRNDQGYLFFGFFSHVICLALMFPVTFLAGMTLPLITATLLKQGYGESGIGKVYAANTLGSIVGVIAAMHLVMPVLGLRQVVIVGGLIDLLLGLWLLYRVAERTHLSRYAMAMSVCAVAIAIGITTFVHFDAEKISSGVFRTGIARKATDVVFHKDGKTSTVEVFQIENGDGIGITTNGKVDALIRKGDTASGDDYTMILSGVLPMMFMPKAENVAVIGIGSGRSTHALLMNPQLKSVDTIEIESAMVEGARHFGALTDLAFTDPRSKIHIDDAKTFFARHQKKYDFIVSEPSNPWVSGVSSLFSLEFYRQVKNYIAEDGLLVQWLQLYEIDIPLIATVMNALSVEFSDYTIYATDDSDILIVASPTGVVPRLSDWVFKVPELRKLLNYIDVASLADIDSRKIGSVDVLGHYFYQETKDANSDYFPVLDQGALKPRFKKQDASQLLNLHPVVAQLKGQPSPTVTLSPVRHYEQGNRAVQAQIIGEYFAWKQGGNAPSRAQDIDVLEKIAAIRSLHGKCESEVMMAVWPMAFADFSAQFLPHLSPGATRLVVADLVSSPCYAQAPDIVKSWLTFFESVGLRENKKEVQELGRKLLSTVRPASPAEGFLQEQIIIASFQLRDMNTAKEILKLSERKPDRSVTLNFLNALVETISPSKPM